MVNDRADELFEVFFQSLLSRHQNGMETSMRASHFTLDCVRLLYYKCHEINLKWGG